MWILTCFLAFIKTIGLFLQFGVGASVYSGHKQSINKKNILKDHTFLIRHILPLGALISSGNCPTNNWYLRAAFHLERRGKKRGEKVEGESKTTEFLDITLCNQILPLLSKMLKLTKYVCHDEQNLLQVVRINSYLGPFLLQEKVL